jgi:transposase
VSDDTARRLAEALEKFGRRVIAGQVLFTEAGLAYEVAALLPVMREIADLRAAEELEAAYWATAAIPGPEAVREVVCARAAALRGEAGR